MDKIKFNLPHFFLQAVILSAIMGLTFVAYWASKTISFLILMITFM